MKLHNLSGFFLILLLLCGAGMSAAYMPPLKNFSEKAYNEALPLEQPSRNLWGRAEHALFTEGRKGVVVGADGVLYSAEEFTCPRGWQTNLERNFIYISSIRQQMQVQGIELRILLVPSKLRVYPQFTPPSCRQGLYEAGRIVTGDQVDLLKLSMASHAPAFMLTDTHWSPYGVTLAAEALAKLAPGLPKQTYELRLMGRGQHKGDLLRYLPGVTIIAEPILKREALATNASLLDDTVPSVVLVGTSYSANRIWTFEDMLRFKLQADVLNMADEGLGPFAVMEKYLNSDSWRETPPKLIIWEIPERYLVLSP